MTQPIFPETSDSALWQPARGLNRFVQRAIVILFGIFALVSVATTIGIVVSLIFETIEFLEKFPCGAF